MKPLALVLLLAGCASGPVMTTPKEVPVPVVVPCEPKLPDVPKWATVGQPASCGDDAACHYLRARAAVVELAQRAAYEVELLAAIASCRKDVK